MADKLFGVAAGEAPAGGKLFGVSADEDSGEEKPWIGQPRPENEGLLSSIYHMPVYGLQDIGAGLKHLTQEGKRRQGAHEMFVGAGEAAVPAVAAGGVASLPALGGAGLLSYLASLGLAVGGGAAGGALGGGAATLLDADPETAQLAADAGTILGAGFGPPLLRRGGHIVSGAAQGAKEGALRKYTRQGGVVPGAVKGAIEAFQKGRPTPTASTAGMTGTEGISRGPFPDVGPINVRGTSDIPAPMPGNAAMPVAQPMPEAPVSMQPTVVPPPPGVDPKAWGQLTPEIQDAIWRGAATRKGAPTARPMPGATEAYSTESPVTVTGQDEVAKFLKDRAEEERVLGHSKSVVDPKNANIAQYFRDHPEIAPTKEAFDKLTNAQYDAHVESIPNPNSKVGGNYKRSTGVGYSRDPAKARQHVRDLLFGPEGPPTSQPMPPK